jgi:hypothetical protein
MQILVNQFSGSRPIRYQCIWYFNISRFFRSAFFRLAFLRSRFFCSRYYHVAVWITLLHTLYINEVYKHKMPTVLLQIFHYQVTAGTKEGSTFRYYTSGGREYKKNRLLLTNNQKKYMYVGRCFGPKNGCFETYLKHILLIGRNI